MVYGCPWPRRKKVEAGVQTTEPTRTSQVGIDLIKSFEGLRLESYYCSANVLTIGYGHTSGVYEGQTMQISPKTVVSAAYLTAELGDWRSSCKEITELVGIDDED
mgnify:CR=1 FL=1